MHIRQSHNILMASNTATQGGQYASYLEAQGYSVRSVYTGADVIARLHSEHTDLIITDLSLPGGDALWILDHLALMAYQGQALVVCSDESDPRLSLIKGRADIIFKPLSLGKLHQAIENLFNVQMTVPEDIAGVINQMPEPQMTAKVSEFGGFIGTSLVMQTLYEQIHSAARSGASVFITGESGTGKEVCAQAIHKYSARSSNAFVPLNCAAIPRDLLESEIFGHVRGAFTGAVVDRDGAATMAAGGTLFLDEIGDMDPQMQTKLLRFLQDGTFQRVGGNRLEHSNVRIICATNRDPVADVKSGRFREDLFYRLHVLPISMPPLRARGQDIIDIAQTLLLTYATEEKKRFKGLAGDAEIVLSRYGWPGNIRQLQNIIRHAVVMYDGIALGAAMLPGYMMQENEQTSLFTGAAVAKSLGDLDGSARRGNTAPSNDDLVVPLHLLERRAIEAAIRVCHGNIPRAAALLQVSPSTLYRKKANWDENAGIPPANTAISETIHSP